MAKVLASVPCPTPPPAPSLADENGPLLTPTEVATIFRVDPKTVTRWAKAGRISCVRTLGGHRRYREREVRDLLAATMTVATLQQQRHGKPAA